MMACSLQETYQRFRETCYLLQSRRVSHAKCLIVPPKPCTVQSPHCMLSDSPLLITFFLVAFSAQIFGPAHLGATVFHWPPCTPVSFPHFPFAHMVSGLIPSSFPVEYSVRLLFPLFFSLSFTFRCHQP
jgi:hypothetical protein